MIKQLKTAFRLLRYAYGFKMCAGFGILFFVIGCILSVFSINFSSPFQGSFFLVMTGLWITQLFFSFGVSGMIKTSPWAKSLQTFIPALVSFIGFAISYIILILLKLAQLTTASADASRAASTELLCTALLITVMMFYCGTAYKFFIFSTIAFFISFMAVSVVSTLYWFSPIAGLPFAAAAGLGSLFIIAGAFLQYGISLLLYKYPLSKQSQLRGLQKYMK